MTAPERAAAREHAYGLLGRLETDSRAVCKLMHYHLWLMLTSDTPDDAGLAEDLLAVDGYLKEG